MNLHALTTFADRHPYWMGVIVFAYLVIGSCLVS